MTQKEIESVIAKAMQPHIGKPKTPALAKDIKLSLESALEGLPPLPTKLVEPFWTFANGVIERMVSGEPVPLPDCPYCFEEIEKVTGGGFTWFRCQPCDFNISNGAESVTLEQLVEALGALN